jgi:hypothetical protein
MQGIKLLVRSFRRLRLFFCGFLKRPTAPLHAPQASLNPVESRTAPVFVYGNTVRYCNKSDFLHISENTIKNYDA